MKLKTFKVIILFFTCGLIFGVFTVLLANLTPYIIWLGASVIFLLGLSASYLIAHVSGWLPVSASVNRHLISALIIAAAYPLAFLVMLGGAVSFDWLYSIMFPMEWREQYDAGNYDFGGFKVGLILAAIAAAILVSFALRIITRRWERQVIALMVLAGIMTIPLGAVFGALIGTRDWFLILFPIGGALFSALCGYWLQRANSYG